MNTQRKEDFELTPKNMLKAFAIIFFVAFILGAMAGIMYVQKYYPPHQPLNSKH